jgi:hypothetical protein
MERHREKPKVVTTRSSTTASDFFVHISHVPSSTLQLGCSRVVITRLPLEAVDQCYILLHPLAFWTAHQLEDIFW